MVQEYHDSFKVAGSEYDWMYYPRIYNVTEDTGENDSLPPDLKSVMLTSNQLDASVLPFAACSDPHSTLFRISWL